MIGLFDCLLQLLGAGGGGGRGVITRHFSNFQIFSKDKYQLVKVEGDIVYHIQSLAIAYWNP